MMLLSSSSSSSSSSSLFRLLLLLLILLLSNDNNNHKNHATAFYLPGVNPYSFADGETVKLKVNKMTSVQTLLPVDYYQLPFCVPEGGPKRDNENLGEFLAGDRIMSSPYRLNMRREMYCEQLCIANMGRGETHGRSPNKMVRAIRKEFRHNWIVDNLSAASRVEDANTVTTKYWDGFPVGFVSPDDRKAYVYNHVNIEITYHPIEADRSFRIVRFMVEPFSIRHEFVPIGDGGDDDDDDDDDNILSGNDGDDDDDDDEEEDVEKVDDDGGGSTTTTTDAKVRVAKISNPIESCAINGGRADEERAHTNYEMITEDGPKFQLASGKVLFTYDVKWIENKKLKWASRWDVYLSMDGAIPAKVHWLSILNSLVIVLVLSAMIAAILVRNLRRDFARYNHLATDAEKAEDLEEFGWKLVHADVFRPPSFSPMLLAVCCGTGAQLLCMSFLTIIFSAMGFLSPANRGALLMAELLLFVMMGGVAGYVTARLYKTFKGKSWQRATTLTALGFPGISFAVFFLMDLLAMRHHSTDAVPFATMFVLLVLWFFISTPLVFFGAYFGYRQDAVEFPVNTSNVPRPIPDQPWFMGIPFTLGIGGILPFGACYVELYFILASVWMDQYYYVFGFLLLVFLILVVTCAEITVLFCYFQLCGENYRWWWRSFCTAGSTALYVFFYSIVYFRQLEANSFATYVLYFGYMALVSLGLFLMTGFIGVTSSLHFNRVIFASIKID